MRSRGAERAGAEGRRVPRARPADEGRLRELPQAGGPRGGARPGAGNREARQGAAARRRQPRSRARGRGGPGRRGRRWPRGGGSARLGYQARARRRARRALAGGNRALRADRASRLTPSTTRPSPSSRLRAPSPARSSRSTSGATASATASCGPPACSSPGEAPEARRWLSESIRTRPSGWARTPPRRRSRRPTASSRVSTTPTATRGTSRPRSASRRSPRPTTSSATRRSARPTTARAARSAPSTWAAPGSIRERWPAGSGTSSRTCSEAVAGRPEPALAPAACAPAARPSRAAATWRPRCRSASTRR